MGTLQPQSNGPLYGNTVTGTLALLGGLLHLVQRGGAWVGCGPTQSAPRCTKCNTPPINGLCTNFIIITRRRYCCCVRPRDEQHSSLRRRLPWNPTHSRPGASAGWRSSPPVSSRRRCRLRHFRSATVSVKFLDSRCRRPSTASRCRQGTAEGAAWAAASSHCPALWSARSRRQGRGLSATDGWTVVDRSCRSESSAEVEQAEWCRPPPMIGCL